MKLVHVALLYLGSVTFFGVDAARVDVATEFKRKWTKWALSRAKRDVKPAGLLRGLGAAADVLPLIRTQDPGAACPADPPLSLAHRVPSSGPPRRSSHALSLFLQQPGGCSHPRVPLRDVHGALAVPFLPSFPLHWWKTLHSKLKDPA
uniref:ADML protein n=1 Tax=Junco hyemalis TaxID=40217 RepID=A0A8C5IGM5_JUNHY